jgi:hypothetical protein
MIHRTKKILQKQGKKMDFQEIREKVFSGNAAQK